MATEKAEVSRANSRFPEGLERTARTGARYAREKQVPRYARNDNQKGKGKGKGKSKGKSDGQYPVCLGAWCN
jgi:hypothetical protein